MKQLVVWGVIGFAAYSGYAYLGVSMTQRQIEGAVENVLELGSHKVPDAVLRSKAQAATASLEVPLEDDQIHVSRDQRHGERIVRVEFEYPLTWSYLGSERTSYRRVDVSHSYPVNEVEEARIALVQETSRRQNEDHRRQTGVARGEYKRRLNEECAKGNTRDVYTTHVRVTDQNTGHSHMVDCSAISHWPD
jgi:hypothetical protein